MATEKVKTETTTPAPGMMLVRKGRFVGQSSRSFDSVPFGCRLSVRVGEVYEVREEFSYLWKDPRFSMMWEWEEGLHEVPAVNPGQVPLPK